MSKKPEQRLPLPIDGYLSQIESLFLNHSNLVVVAEPGAGKTTRLPPACLNWIESKKILVLVPRRIAAQMSADRICYENQWQLGQECGYQVRFDSKVSASTRLIFLTEALLIKKMMQDPELSDVSTVILDEFHERSLWTDLSIGLLKECQQLSRPDLKIIVMSATLDADKVARYLSNDIDSAPIIQVPGKVFPLHIENQKESQIILTTEQWNQKITEKIQSILTSYPSDTLVFLPGVSEINRIKERLLERLPSTKFDLRTLHGQQNLSEQKLNLSKNKDGLIRVILCTNVAESSITVDGVDQVIDCGLQKVNRYNLKTDVDKLETVRISKASAKQRAGRAARQTEGRCFRLWNQLDERSMLDFDTPEVLRSKLTDVVLILAHFGASPDTFGWFEKPNEDLINSAIQECERLRLSERNLITDLGRKVLSYPLPARISLAYIKSIELGHPVLGAALCAILSEKDSLSMGHVSDDCDIKSGLESLMQGNGPFQVKKVMEQLLPHSIDRNISKFSADILFQILWDCFSDRLCRRRRSGEGSAISTIGKAYSLSNKSHVIKADYFFALKMIDSDKSSDVMISMACSVTEDWVKKNLANLSKVNQSLEFDEKSKQIYIEEFKAIDKMPLEAPRRRQAKVEEVSEILPDLVIKNWNYVLNRNESLKNHWNRISYFSENVQIIDINDQILFGAIQDACYGESQFESVIQKDFWHFIQMRLKEYSDQSTLLENLERSCPTKWKAPSGREFVIQYQSNQLPYIELKIQDCFGLRVQPTILNGKVPITFHLLGPHMRPVQVTSSIESFWKNTYPEIRAEYKIRYPKHKWPEDPTKI